MHMPQQFSRGRVSRVFKPDAIARFQQRMSNQLDGMAISRCHEYLGRGAIDPARNLEIARRFRHAAPASHIPRDEPCRRAAWRARIARPAVPRSFVEIDPGPASPFETAGSNPGESWSWRRRGRTGASACKGRSRLEVGRHNGPCLATGLNVPLGSQQRIGGFDGASRQPQFSGQRSRRGNAITRLQQSALNRSAKPIVDLAI